MPAQVRVVIYVDNDDKIRWRILGKGSSAIISDSGQGYRHKADAIRGLLLSTGGVYERVFRSHNKNGVYEQGWIKRFDPDLRIEEIFVEYKRSR